MNIGSIVSATSCNNKQLIIIGGVSGLLSIISYLIIAFTSLPNAIVFFLAMMFPILGIVFLFSVREYINVVRPSHSNNLGFVFGTLAFTLCAILLAIQLAVQIGIDITSLKEDTSNLKLIKESIRLVDMGVDVAWDMFIGTYLILFSLATQKIKSLKWWGIGLGIMGVALMILNTATFPEPPADSGLFDLGPFIAMTLFGLALQMIRIGRNFESR